MSPTPVARSVRGKQNSVSFILDFTPRDVIISQRGEYTTVSMSKSAPRGETGEPSLPWRKVYVSLPEGAKVKTVNFKINKQALLTANVVIDPIQPNVPTDNIQSYKQIKMSPVVYARVKNWPKTLAEFITVRFIGGKPVAEIAVCPFQYQPETKNLYLVQELAITLTFDAAVRPQIQPPSKSAVLFEAHTLTKIKDLVVNPTQVKSIFKPKIPPLDLFIYPHVPFVIITSAAMSSGYQNLADWRTVLGLNARIVTIEDIQANTVANTKNAKFWLTSGYSDGGTRDLAEAIRNFIKWAVAHWQTEYVVLGGDTDIIPARKALILLDTMGYGNFTDTNTYTNLISSVSASTAAAGYEADKANDDNAATYWKCATSDASPWITAALGGFLPVNKIQLVWGTTSASSYKVQVSNDNSTWTDVYTTTSGGGGTVDIPFTCICAYYVRLLVLSGTNFKLCTLKVFGPPTNKAFVFSATRTRIYLNSWMSTNPTNSLDGDLMLIIDGSNAGTIIPYDTAANDTTLGWHFVSDLVKSPPTVAAGYTKFIEICGPATFHGSMFASKTDRNYIPTDLYYSDLNSPSATHHDWDADDNKIYGERYNSGIDSVNGVEDVHLGRLSVSGLTQVANIVDKIIHYETYRENSLFEPFLPLDFATSILLASQNWYDPGPGYLDGSPACNENIRKMLLTHAPSWDFTRLYEDKDDVPAADVTPDLQLASKDAIKAAISEGNNLVSLVSHGSPSYVCYLIPSDVDDESNIPSIWYGNACSTNAFDNSAAISETSIRNSVGGSVAYVGNSRYGWTGDGPMEKSFWEEMFYSGVLGSMLESAHQTGGDWQKYSINLLGDPAMRVWSATPMQLTVTHVSEIFTGSQSFVVTVKANGSPVPSALVCASMKNMFCVTGLTNASGVATLTINPPSAGTMRVAVSGKNLIPYLGSVIVKQSVSVCTKKLVCKVPELCALPIGGFKCPPKIIVDQCKLALMCKNLVACNMQIEGECKILLGGGGCPNIDPWDWRVFQDIFERFGYADIEEFAKQAKTPEVMKQLAALPDSVRKPIEMLLAKIRTVGP